MRFKRVITVHLSNIDLKNLQAGEEIFSAVKTSEDAEIYYEIRIVANGEKTAEYERHY
jgi:hypothetical protein